MNNLVPATAINTAPAEWIGSPVPQARATPLERILAVVYRQRFWALGAFLLVLLIGAYLTFTAPREYTAVASVQLEQQTPRIIDEEGLDPQPSAGDADRFLQTHLDRVRTRSLAEDVAANLQVEKSPDLLKALGVSTDGSPDAIRESAIQKLQSNVRSGLGLKTRMARIRFTSYDPVASATIANAYAEALTAANLNSKISTAEKAKQYLNTQLASAKSRLESSERRMLSYARSADLTTAIAPGVSNGDVGSFRSQQVSAMTDTLSQATARRIDAQQQWQQVSGTPALQLPEVQSNSAVQNLYAERARLEATLAEDRQRHTEEWPSIAETTVKIAQLNNQINAMAANIKSSFFGRYAAAHNQEQQIAASLGQLRNSAMAERERNVGFNSLKREVETNKAFYDGLLQRYKEVAAASGAPAANIILVDPAGPPLEPSSPNVSRDLAMAGVAGLILAILVGAAREGMTQYVRVAEDIERSLNVRALGVVPMTARHALLSRGAIEWNSSQAEAHHSIAVALEQVSSGELPKTLLVTSSSASEGKSTTALGLAKSLTEMGKRVLLIDGDLRHPSLPNYTNGEATPGLTEVLTGEADPQQAIQQDTESGFDFVAAGQDRARPIAVLAKPQIHDVLRELSEDYDIVIIDGPPILGLADAVLLARSAEATLFVVESNRLHWSELDNALSRLPANDVVGAVVTKFNAKAAGVRYGAGHYYSY